MLSRFFRTIALSPDPAPVAPAPPAVPPVDPARRADDFTTRMIAQHGTVENALRAVTMRMLTAEDAVAGLTSQVDQLKAKLPEGSIVLPKAEAMTWQKLQDLKLTPDEIAAAVKERDTLKGTVSRTEAAKQLRIAAKAQGLDEDAFEDHGLRANIQVEMRDTSVTEHGKMVTKKMPFVRPAGDDKAAFKPLSEYTTALPAHDQRALKAAPVVPTGTPYIEQRPTPTTPASPTDAVMGDLRKRYPLPSELKQKQGA